MWHPRGGILRQACFRLIVIIIIIKGIYIAQVRKGHKCAKSSCLDFAALSCIVCHSPSWSSLVCSVYYSILENLCFTCVTHVFFLLALRSQNQRMDGSWVCYEQLGYGVVSISHDWILRPVPLFLGRWGNCLKFCRKFDGAVIQRIVITKRLNVWKRGNIPLKEIITLQFGWKKRKSPFSHFWGTVMNALGLLSRLPLTAAL